MRYQWLAHEHFRKQNIKKIPSIFYFQEFSKLKMNQKYNWIHIFQPYLNKDFCLRIIAIVDVHNIIPFKYLMKESIWDWSQLQIQIPSLQEFPWKIWKMLTCYSFEFWGIRSL